jgi:thioesterase domain-containing protein
MVKPLKPSQLGAVASVSADSLSTSIVPLRAGGRYPPLFCMHDGNFKDMAAVLQTDRAVYGVGYRCSDEMKSSLTIECLAANHLEEIFKVQPHGPYYLIGYSIGAIAAYEMATLLVSQGESVGLVALVDIYNPALHHASTSEAVQFRRRYRADRLRKYMDNLARGDFYRIALDASKLVKRKVKALSNTLVGRLFMSSTTRMLSAYSPRAFQGRMVLFRVDKPMDGGAEFEHDPSLGWSNYAKGGVDVQYVAGGHGTVVERPYVTDLAAKLAPYLNKSDR